jgi:3-hydroxyacyl-CoA dehydrogenase
MLRQRGVQSAFMLEEGALPQQIDKVIYDFGFPMGPFAMSDLASNDESWRIQQEKKEKFLNIFLCNDRKNSQSAN